jgi:hypothetical protein
MPNTTVRAAATGLPNSRRAVLRSIIVAGAAVATVPAAGAMAATIASAADGADSELFALEAAIGRLDATAREIDAKRVQPFEDEWYALVLSDYPASRAFSAESGREAAVVECERLTSQGASLFARMIALPAQTQAGRAAKVRTFLSFVANDDWRGPSRDLDWEIEGARKLLGEFAGMTEEELANV